MSDNLFRIYTIMDHLMVFACLRAKKTFCAPASIPLVTETSLTVLLNLTFESYEVMEIAGHALWPSVMSHVR